MSTHRRVKDLTAELDDDDYAEYDDDYAGEDEELDEENQKQMNESTKAVRSSLGQAYSHIATKTIQDILWDTYYDVPKTLAQLKKSHPPPASSKKTPSKFDQAAQAAASVKSTKSGELPNFSDGSEFSAGSYGTNQCETSRGFSYSYSFCRSPNGDLDSSHKLLTAAEYFKDTPWLNVPPHRLGNIGIEPLYPRIGLLGGSASSSTGKTSKLAALAAQRKKSQEDKRKAQEVAVPPVSSKESTPPVSTASFEKLSIKENDTAPRTSPRSDTKRQLESQDADSPRKLSKQQDTQIRQPPSHHDTEAHHSIPTTQQADVRAGPSAFAATLMRPSSMSNNDHLAENSLFHFYYPHISGMTDPFKGPSPDDVVQNAQAKGNASKSSKNKSDKSVEEGVKDLKLEETPKVQSKNLDIVAEYEKSNLKDSASFVVVGHIDHGKSTLMGRLLHDLNVINDRTIEKLQKSAQQSGKGSFAYAWVLDEREDEREHGVTASVATKSFNSPKTGKRFTLLDAPGHADFVPKMIAGAAQADFAILVIDASTNAFEAGLRGQTKEHILLIRSMRISRVIIAVNKMDVAGWNQERFQDIKQQMTAFLTGTGFNEANLAFIPCAGLTGENVASAAPKTASWYKDPTDSSKAGPSIIDALDASSTTARKISEPLRMTIDDVFKGSVLSPVSVSGRIDAGATQVGETILCQPSGEAASIRAIELDDGEPVDWIVAGQIATLHLNDIDPIHLRPGNIICSIENPVRNIRKFLVKILCFTHLMPGFVEIHKGATYEAAQVTRLLATFDKSTGLADKKKPRVIKPEQIARVEIVLDREIPLESGSRVVLRTEGTTIGAGIVEKVE